MAVRSDEFWVHTRTLRDDPPDDWFRVATPCLNDGGEDFAEMETIREAENWLHESGLRGEYAWAATAYATGNSDESEDSVTFAFSDAQAAFMFKLRFA